jgi:predicted Zn-dependent protease
MDRLHLIFIGEIEPDILEEVARSLEQIFDVHVRKEKPMAVPANTFKAFREQYHSTSLLQRLRTFHPLEQGFKVLLGIIDRDLFVRSSISSLVRRMPPCKRQSYRSRDYDPNSMRCRRMRSC